MEKECGKASALSLVTNTEGKTSELRKIKKSFHRKQKEEEFSLLNSRFFADPGSVYSKFNDMTKEDKDNPRPVR